MPQSTIASSINYRETLFEGANLTTIRGKPTFETLHKLPKQIKDNSESVHSNLGGGAHDHISLVLTYAQYMLMYNTTLVDLDHLGPLIIPDGTIFHNNCSMRITHNKAVCLFREVIGVEQPLIQKIVTTVEETYLTYIRNHTTNYINDNVADVLTHIQDNYGQFITQKLLEC